MFLTGKSSWPSVIENKSLLVLLISYEENEVLLLQSHIIFLLSMFSSETSGGQNSNPYLRVFHFIIAS